MPQPPLKAESIEHWLDETFEVIYSFRHTRPAADNIAQLDRNTQDYILDWAKRIASTNIELAFQFANLATVLLQTTDRNTIEAWALHAMNTYDRQGLYPALKVMRKIDDFQQRSHERAVGAVLEEQINVLQTFVQGLSGRKLKLEVSEHCYTDSETLFLPTIMARLSDAGDNFRLYKASVTFLWAQTRFGTFRIDLDRILEQQSQTESFLALFHAMESLRLETCIQRELPGLYRDIQQLRQQLAMPPREAIWQQLREQLSQPDCNVETTLALTLQHAGRLAPPDADCFHGELHPHAVASCMAARIENEKARLRIALRQIIDETFSHSKPQDPVDAPVAQAATEKFDASVVPDPNEPDGLRIELSLHDQPVAPPAEVKSLISSIVQDLGEIPDEYLTAAGDGEYDPQLFEEQTANPDDVWSGTYHEEGAYIYKEWDYQRQHYRKNWCAVREKDVTPIYDDFVTDTLHKYQGLVKHLRKTFEAMRDEDRLLRRQVDGDGIDIDALVEALADARDGSELSDRLFTQLHRTERNIAVIFMVDMSGSTKGWINQAERESLLLLCESLEALGDRYAIYGFSGMTRKRCEVYRVKTFEQHYDAEVQARINGMTPQDYTRMGFAIRHLSHLLKDIDARTRILITLSDGKPDDYDSYRGDYGIEDTRRALIEARRDGIHPYCITIDKEARDYLPHMYGPAAYTVLDEVRQLPLKVSDIYRKLTT